MRNFCHATGLLESNEDFADRKNPEGKITVRLARTFVVNFFNGRKLSKSKIDELIPIPHVCKSGQDDPEYVVIAGKKIWNDKELIEAGSRFSLLHKKQMETIGQDPDLNNAEFRNKAISMAVLSSWAFTAGVLQENPTALKKLYSLPDLSGNQDPLNAKTMSESRHPKDAPTYRGLGTRYSEEDRGRVTELFIQYATTLQKKVISGPMVDAAIMNYEAKVAALKAKQAKAKLQ